jgi:AcrR family transcriptional regulator
VIAHVLAEARADAQKLASQDRDDSMKSQMKDAPKQHARGVGRDELTANGRAPGLRERNKRAKELLIRTAARELFLQRGFEATTLRDVAERADVGFGTVFAYAHDKAGLLAMVFVEELKALPALFAASNQAMSVLDEIVEAFGHLYVFWASIPALSGHVLQQMEFYSDNPHMDAIVARRIEARHEVVCWLESRRQEQRIRSDVSIERAADTLFAIYTSAVREWSAGRSGNVTDGKRRLRALMELPILAILP